MNLDKIIIRLVPVGLLIVGLSACQREAIEPPPVVPEAAAERFVEPGPEVYAPVVLTADLSGLSANQKKMLPLFIEASEIMDDLFWEQAFGPDHEKWLQTIADDRTREFARLNYGPWDRLNDEIPFIKGIGEKPPGARFYPLDMTRDEFEASPLPGKIDLYSLIERDAAGALTRVPYHVAYAEPLARAANLLRQAAQLAEDQAFRQYLELRATALLNDDYFSSDIAWMNAKTNPVDIVIGPIETYEDRLFGFRAGYEAYVLIKDQVWSERLARFAAFLPKLQRELPVPEKYKAEEPGTDSDLNAYDVIYYAGHSNAGGKTIAINLPNDENVQLQKGTRRLQLKNAMKAKFEKILLPIADVLVDDSQRQHVTFDAFFANTMFHEVAHGLGIKNTLTDKGPVRTALLDLASSMEEGKADVLGLYMVTKLHEAGELGDADLMDNYVTFMAGIFRSVRFGASDAHGKANMVRFNYFADHQAFSRDAATGKYKVDFDRMQEAMNGLSNILLTLQGDGDYEGVAKLTESQGVVPAELQSDLDRLTDANIPVDITFIQGVKELKLD